MQNAEGRHLKGVAAVVAPQADNGMGGEEPGFRSPRRRVRRRRGGEVDAPGPFEPGSGRFRICRGPQGIRFGLHQTDQPKKGRAEGSPRGVREGDVSAGQFSSVPNRVRYISL